MNESATDFKISGLIETASIEATPTQIAKFTTRPQWLNPATKVYVPFLPNSNFEHTIQACKTLSSWGMEAVPHLPARAIPSITVLHQWCEAIVTNNINQLLLIAGDIKSPAGSITDTLAVLDSGVLEQYPITSIGVAGHPEGHPIANQQTLQRALAKKIDYTQKSGIKLWVVTQFSFEAQTVINWLNEYRPILANTPVIAGIAGPTKLKNLLVYANQCGVMASAQMLTKHMSAMRLLRPWLPDTLLTELGQFKASQPHTNLAGIHLFPFGGLQQSANWLTDHTNQSNG
ncbi:methylenetetrahydrofolate reductase [Shewanella marina]|uniref:methylenetetrahydrofolate reductase n=1 Tax=Shewanella marina TaxID=487319 RepID=UPI0004703DCB|nr:methylenetetrahydrofolate reductase [Shewanella marina]